MSTKQPQWKCIANLGDASPFEYGGYFVLIDETGVYPPEGEYLYVSENENEKPYAELYRFILEPCTYQNGILSDNPFHPAHAVWFADRLGAIAQSCDVDESELVRMFTSSDALDRAHAWRSVGDYFGFHELDSYKLTFDNLFRLARFARKHRAHIWPKP